MTKPREAALFSLAGALVVGVVGLVGTAGQGPFRIFRFWGLVAGFVVWLSYRAIRYGMHKGAQ